MADRLFDSIKPPDWPADHVERRQIASLLPYARNARTHSEAQVKQLAKLITAYGWTNPVLVDPQGVLIAGHGRVLAAQSLGLREVPAMVASGWSDDQIKAYRLADNASAAQAGWDDGLLKLELGELDAAGFDMELTGFDSGWLEQLAAPDFDAEAEWQDMPEFEQPDAKAYQDIVVHFSDQAAVETFSRLIGQPLTNKTRFIWFPRVERRSGDERYVNESAVSDLHSF